MGSDALAPAFVHNVFDPLEIGGAQRSDVAVRAIDDFGEMRQFDLLVWESKFSIKVLKQRIARTSTFLRVQAASRLYPDHRGWQPRSPERLPRPAIPSASECLDIGLSSEHRL